jgi:hypothetical protein
LRWRERFCCAWSIWTRAVSIDCRICSSVSTFACSDAVPLSTRVLSDFGSICSRNCPLWMRSPSCTARLTTRPGVSAAMLTSRLGWIFPDAETIASRSRVLITSVVTDKPLSFL